MPADYVNKLARMFQDIKVSEDLNQSFKEMHKHNKLALPGKHGRTEAEPGFGPLLRRMMRSYCSNKIQEKRRSARLNMYSRNIQ